MLHKSPHTLNKKLTYKIVKYDYMPAHILDYLYDELRTDDVNFDEVIVLISNVSLFHYPEISAPVNFLLYPDGNIWGYSSFIQYGAAERMPGFSGKVSRSSDKLVEIDRDCLWTLQESANQFIEEINWVADHLSDNFSKEKYLNLFFQSLTDISLEWENSIFTNIQYFDYVNYFDSMIILNAGVEEGSELLYFDALSNHTCLVYNVDPSGHDKLSSPNKSLVVKHNSRYKEIREVLWDKCDFIEVPVTKNGEVLSQYYGNNIHNFDTKIFNSISIEKIISENKIRRLDLIKMDIEGAELKVIENSIDIIKLLRPQLAISIYHLPSHYWEIPKILLENLENYNFYFGHYSPGRWEGILYGIPCEYENRQSSLVEI